MKKFMYIITGCLFGASLLFSCSSSGSDEASESQNEELITREIAHERAVENPNESSELALLMRDVNMMVQISKEMINEGKEPLLEEEPFTLIHSAVPTELHVKDEGFFKFADVMVQSVKDFNNREIPALEAHNNLVASCLACHQNYCPGPKVRIKKLKLGGTTRTAKNG
jgi:hypothetical protein